MVAEILTVAGLEEMSFHQALTWGREVMALALLVFMK